MTDTGSCYNASIFSACQPLRVSSVKNFLKTAAHQHKDPQVRLSFIHDLDASTAEAQDLLSGLARNDSEVAVRVAAINKLDELNTLRELLSANGDEGATVADAAEERLVQKLTAGDVSDIAVRVLLSTHAARLAVPIASHTAVSAQRDVALAAIDDEASLVMVVQQSRFHDTRLAAALRLSQHDALRSALSAVRSKDKVVAKQIQQRLDAAAAAEAALIARRHAVSTTLKTVQTLVEGVWTPQHGGRLQAARERWAGFDAEDTAEADADFDAAVSAALLRLEEYNAVASTQTDEMDEQAVGIDDLQPRATVAGNELAQSASPTDDGAAAQSAGIEDSEPGELPAADSLPVVVPRIDDPALTPVLETLKPCSIETLPATLVALQAQLDSESGESASEHVAKVLAYGTSVSVLFDPPYDINKARPGALQSRMRRVRALVDVDSLLPGIELSEHVFVRELKDHLDVLNDRLSKARQESSDRIKATHRQFAALSGIVKEGKWGPANSMLRRLQKKLAAMESGERVGLDEKLARAEQQLAEMADWQDFAARPKLEALCESMESLASTELAPDALAKEVRELQSAWKSMGVSRASNDLWARFKTAGDIAYAPCKAWFDEKQQERQLKLDAKSNLCKKLEDQQATLTAEPDWREIVRLVNNAKRDWSKNRVPDRKPDKALEARFSAALKPFETALGEQYTANAEAKKSLLEKVAALAEADEITQHSANQAKSLLSAWKLVGIMRRKEDQALWEAFNGHLGTIFKHQHQVEREKQRAGLEHVFRAKDIIKHLKQLSREDAIDDAQVQALSVEFQALDEFPERDKKFLLRDFRQALDACSRVQVTASKRRVVAEMEERARLAALCEQLEMAVELPESATDTLLDDVAHAWEASDARVTADVAAMLQKRRDDAMHHLREKTQPDYDANEERRRDLLIRMEVAAGVDTPAEDKSRRMQYQLRHLQEGMTSAALHDPKQVLDDLELQWLGVGPVRRAVSDSLQSRFLKAYRR